MQSQPSPGLTLLWCDQPQHYSNWHVKSIILIISLRCKICCVVTTWCSHPCVILMCASQLDVVEDQGHPAWQQHSSKAAAPASRAMHLERPQKLHSCSNSFPLLSSVIGLCFHCNKRSVLLLLYFQHTLKVYQLLFCSFTLGIKRTLLALRSDILSYWLVNNSISQCQIQFPLLLSSNPLLFCTLCKTWLCIV